MVPANSAVVSPLQRISGGIRAESPTAGRYSHTPEIQPIRIPASLQGGIPRHKPIRVELARLKEQIETGIIQVHQSTSQRARKEGPAQTMSMVDTLVHSARIMKQREQGQHFGISSVQFGDRPSIFKDPRPVENPVRAQRWQCVSFKHGFQYGWMVMHLSKIERNKSPLLSKPNLFSILFPRTLEGHAFSEGVGATAESCCVTQGFGQRLRIGIDEPAGSI